MIKRKVLISSDQVIRVDLSKKDTISTEPDWDAMAEKELAMDSYERGYEVA